MGEGKKGDTSRQGIRVRLQPVSPFVSYEIVLALLAIVPPLTQMVVLCKRQWRFAQRQILQERIPCGNFAFLVPGYLICLPFAFSSVSNWMFREDIKLILLHSILFIVVSIVFGNINVWVIYVPCQLAIIKLVKQLRVFHTERLEEVFLSVKCSTYWITAKSYDEYLAMNIPADWAHCVKEVLLQAREWWNACVSRDEPTVLYSEVHAQSQYLRFPFFQELEALQSLDFSPLPLIEVATWHFQKKT